MARATPFMPKGLLRAQEQLYEKALLYQHPVVPANPDAR
jgi:hypothetical protein